MLLKLFKLIIAIFFDFDIDSLILVDDFPLLAMFVGHKLLRLKLLLLLRLDKHLTIGVLGVDKAAEHSISLFLPHSSLLFFLSLLHLSLFLQLLFPLSHSLFPLLLGVRGHRLQEAVGRDLDFVGWTSISFIATIRCIPLLSQVNHFKSGISVTRWFFNDLIIFVKLKHLSAPLARPWCLTGTVHSVIIILIINVFIVFIGNASFVSAGVHLATPLAAALILIRFTFVFVIIRVVLNIVQASVDLEYPFLFVLLLDLFLLIENHGVGCVGGASGCAISRLLLIEFDFIVNTILNFSIAIWVIHWAAASIDESKLKVIIGINDVSLLLLKINLI